MFSKEIWFILSSDSLASIAPQEAQSSREEQITKKVHNWRDKCTGDVVHNAFDDFYDTAHYKPFISTMWLMLRGADICVCIHDCFPGSTPSTWTLKAIL